MKIFTPISATELQGNTFKMIGKDWMLITAGSKDNCNTMTASWGGFGELWFKPVVYIFIRPQRHTLSFINTNDYFTLSFLDEEFRDALTFCGKHSGKLVQKINEAGLSLYETPNKSVGINEARVIIECKKLYSDTIKEENFIDTSGLQHYPEKDFHIMFIGEITNTLVTHS